MKAPIATMQGPIATMKAPVATMKAPVATMKAPVANMKSIVPSSMLEAAKEAPKPISIVEPVKEEPKPIYKSEPIKDASKPVYKSEPVNEAPKPIKFEPVYEFEAPKPIYKSEPIKDAPKPVYKSEPVNEAPRPIKFNPVNEAPKPVYKSEPVKEAPKPVYKSEPVKQVPRPIYESEPVQDETKAALDGLISVIANLHNNLKAQPLDQNNPQAVNEKKIPLTKEQKRPFEILTSKKDPVDLYSMNHDTNYEDHFYLSGMDFYTEPENPRAVNKFEKIKYAPRIGQNEYVEYTASSKSTNKDPRKYKLHSDLKPMNRDYPPYEHNAIPDEETSEWYKQPYAYQSGYKDASKYENNCIAPSASSQDAGPGLLILGSSKSGKEMGEKNDNLGPGKKAGSIKQAEDFMFYPNAPGK